METKRKSAKVVVSVLTLAALVVFSLMVYAGDLEPSAPPGPTMKTLDEVEPRIPIPGSDTPASVFTISESGTYYLTGNRLCSSTGIQVDANNVTIDLMGYSLIGLDSGIAYGIYMNERSNVEIRNGTVRDFYYGIHEAGATGGNHRIINVRAVSNTQGGIRLNGSANLVKDCTVSENGDAAGDIVYGIYAYQGSTVTGNTVSNNGNNATGSDVYGIYARFGSTVTGNTVSNNGDSASGSYVYGIRAETGSTVTGNTVYGNGDFAGGNVRGIFAYYGCTVTGNTAYDNGDSATNTAYGIYLVGYNLVDQNTAYSNGTGASSATNITYGVTGCVYGINVPPAP